MKITKIMGLLCVLSFVLGMFSQGTAEELKRIAIIVELNGIVEVKASKQAWAPAQEGMVLLEGDIIRTEANSSTLLNLDGMAETATVEIKENSQLRLAELIENKREDTQKTLLDLALGEILIKAQKLHSEKSSFEVKTPTTVVGVRGTTFAVSVESLE